MPLATVVENDRKQRAGWSPLHNERDVTNDVHVAAHIASLPDEEKHAQPRTIGEFPATIHCNTCTRAPRFRLSSILWRSNSENNAWPANVPRGGFQQNQIRVAEIASQKSFEATDSLLLYSRGREQPQNRVLLVALFRLLRCIRQLFFIYS